MINRRRLRKDFLTLIDFDSVSFQERRTADWLKACLDGMGFEVQEDNAGNLLGGDAGNLHAFRKGTAPGDPVLFSAHMDVVQPGIGKKPRYPEEGKITSDGTTVLGADDVCGIVEILEGIRHVTEEKIPHRDIELLFTVGEEAYARGSGVFDYSKMRAKEAYVLDMHGPVGRAAVAAPSIISFEISLRGKASHAGFAPEKGVHAILAMADLIQRLPNGRYDAETTMNVGLVSGGSAPNIVPEECVCTGEIRSSRHERALACVSELNDRMHEVAESRGVRGKLRTQVHLHSYHTPEDADSVRHFQSACRKLSLPGELRETFGGSDNNHFVENGLDGIVLSCGMYEAHSLKEYTMEEDLEKGAALVAELMQPQGESAGA